MNEVRNMLPFILSFLSVTHTTIIRERKGK